MSVGSWSPSLLPPHEAPPSVGVRSSSCLSPPPLSPCLSSSSPVSRPLHHSSCILSFSSGWPSPPPVTIVSFSTSSRLFHLHSSLLLYPPFLWIDQARASETHLTTALLARPQFLYPIGFPLTSQFGPIVTTEGTRPWQWAGVSKEVSVHLGVCS